MPTFDYKAKDEEGKTITGSVVVQNAEELEKVLDQKNLFMISYKQQASYNNILQGFFKNEQETLMFTIQMSTALQSGLPLIEILDDMIEEATSPQLKRMLGDIKINIEAGNSFADSLGLYPNYFNEIYRIIVRTGEGSGKLDLVFKDLVGLLEWDRELKKQMKKAMRFPLTMGMMLGGLILIVLKVVIPNFADLFSSGGTELPGPTLFLLSCAEFLDEYWILLIGVISLTIISWKFYTTTEQGKYNRDAIKLKLPFFGTLIQKIAMSRFAHFWKILFDSGIDLAQALEMVSDVVQNKKIQEAVLIARQDIMNGRSMTGSFKDVKMFPNLVLKMINLGESTGALDSSLEKISKYYDREVPEAIEAMLAAMQPVIMIVMAGVLIIVALAIVLPMFGMMNAIH